MSALRRAVDWALRLLYPTRAVCMGCGSLAGCEKDWLCDECRQALAKRWVGARPLPPGCGIDGAAFAYYYQGPAGGMVRRLKYDGVHRLAEPMARAMAKAERFMEPTGAEWIVPVPMHPKRLRLRGFNHAEKLAQAVGAQLGLPCVNALSRTRNAPQQARLSEEARRANLKDAFAVNRPLEGRRILMVDDVYTTGTTARSCAQALREGGAANVYVLCFALAEQDGGQDG